MSAVSHVHPGEECSICTHESEAAALPGLRATRGTSHTCSPTHTLYLSPKERGWVWSLCSKGTFEANVCSMVTGFCFKITTCCVLRQKLIPWRPGLFGPQPQARGLRNRATWSPCKAVCCVCT